MDSSGWRLAIALAACMSFGTAPARSNGSNSEDIVWLPYPGDGIVLGQGYDLLGDHKTPSVCVNFHTVSDPGYETTYNVSRIESFAESFSAFGVSASGQLSLALLTAKANLQFTNSARKSSNSENFALTVRVQRGAKYASPIAAGTSTSEDPSGPIREISFREFRFDSHLDRRFDEICGTHYVTAILEGVDLRAVLTAQQSSEAGKTSFSGQVEVNVAEIFKGSGSISGDNDTATRIAQGSLDAYILGGEQYQLPTDVDGLVAFAKDMTALHADKTARPMWIGLAPYRTLGSKAGAFELADTLGPGIFAYFTARDALDRFNMINTSRLGTDPGLILMDEIGLYREQDAAYANMINIRHALRICRDRLTEVNRERSRLAFAEAEASPAPSPEGRTVDLDDVYRLMTEIAVEERDRAVNAMLALHYNAPEPNDLEERSRLTNPEDLVTDNCLTGLTENNDVKDATGIFLRSLALMPLYPEDLKRDPYITPERLGDAAAAVAENSSVQYAALSAELADLWGERAACPVTINENFPVTDPFTPVLIQEVDEACLNRVDSRIAEKEQELQNLNAGLTGNQATLAQAIGRHVYRAHFEPARRSICGDDLRHEICGLPYNQVVDSFVATMRIIPSDAKAIADALLPVPVTIVTPPVEVKPDGKPPVEYRPAPGCRPRPGHSYCIEP